MFETPSPLPDALHLFDELAALSSLTSTGSGATEAAWRDCASRLLLAADAFDLAPGQRAKLLGRAHEALSNARAAAHLSRTQRVPVLTRGQLPALERCPGCGLPAHASETDDAGYHPGCAPRRDETQRLPVGWSPRAKRSSLPVHASMNGARASELAFAKAVTMQLPVFGGDELPAVAS